MYKSVNHVNMIKIKTIIMIFCVFISSISFAANPSKEINSKCRQNIKILKKATEKMLSKEDYGFSKWTTYQQALNTFFASDKYLEVRDIKGPTPNCEYCLVSLSKNDWQWLCLLHGVSEGNKTYSLKYHEFVLQGKSHDKYMVIEQYKEHVQHLLSWTNYTLTPKEFIKYHYNMNPIFTTVTAVILIVVSFILLKSFFRF